MRFSFSALPLLCAATTAVTAFDFSQYAGKTTTSSGAGDRAVPGRYFVEFDTSAVMQNAVAQKRDANVSNLSHNSRDNR
jgi:hypothetical protein